jgi:hypothetical protein
MTAHEQEEDEDYMDDALLVHRAAPSGDAPATGVDGASSNKRAKQGNLSSSSAPLSESQILARGLSTAIPEDNLGFQMLAKLGYKPEEHAQRPLDIVVKTDRMGIGLDTELKAKAAQIRDQALDEARQRGLQEDQIRERYLRDKGRKFEARRALGQLHKARKVLGELNEQLGIPAATAGPASATQDPREINVDGDDEDAPALLAPDDGDDAAEPDLLPVLQDVVDALRAPPYLWCFWCASRFESAQDLTDNCPGLYEEDHE